MRKRAFTILCLEGAVLSFNVAACAALVPSIARDLAVSQFIAGRIVWIYMLAYGIAALLYGPLVRAYDAKKIELASFFLFSLANLLAALSRDIPGLFFARFLMGAFGASVIPLALILISRQVAPQSRGRYVGIFFSGTFISSLLGLFLSGLVSWRAIFLIPAVLGFILWIHIYFYLPNFKPEAGGFRLNYLAALKDKTVISVFTYILFISLFYHGIQQWLGVYFSKGFGFDQLTISLLITFTSLSGIFGEFFGGRLSDSLGRLKTVNLGLILMVASLFALVFKAPVFILAMLMAAWGLGWTFNHAGLSTMLTDLPEKFLNEAASLNSSLRFVSGGIGAALGGLLMQHGFNSWIIFFGLGLVSLLVFARRMM